MEPMIYQKERDLKILYQGIYNGYKFKIISLGTHPCAYVMIPKGHLYYGKQYDDIDLECHYGITFSGKLKGDKINWWIGWDYTHSGDFYFHKISLVGSGSNDKKWTTEEIFEEVKEVIDNLILKVVEKI